MDRYLGEAGSGPTWLQREDIAQLVLRSIQYAGDPLRFYNLHAWVIMSNHVHLLVAPRVVPARFLQLDISNVRRGVLRILWRAYLK
jgi:REP element-mobilizing transposase RayT